MTDSAEPSAAPILREGAVALVTGASAGIGAAVAEALIARGCRVIGTARGRAALEKLGERLGPAFHAHPLDVSDGPAVARLLDDLPPALREIDILVNNAGHDAGGRRRLDLGAVEDWAAIIDTNVTGMIRMTHAVAPGMVARRRGHIVNLGSIAGLRAYPGGAIYAASKFAVRGLSDALRMDYAEHGIRVSEVLPGTARTEFALRRWGDAARAEAFYESYPELLTAEDVARCVLFALDQPPDVTIAQIVVVPRSQTI